MINGSCHCSVVNWEFDSRPSSATACNCTLCSRYGALWAYGQEQIDVGVSGPTKVYAPGDYLEIHFCHSCGCIAYWRSLELDSDGKRSIAVNLRLADINLISDIPIHRFDGRDSFKGLPNDGRCIINFCP